MLYSPVWASASGGTGARRRLIGVVGFATSSEGRSGLGRLTSVGWLTARWRREGLLLGSGAGGFVPALSIRHGRRKCCATL